MVKSNEVQGKVRQAKRWIETTPAEINPAPRPRSRIELRKYYRRTKGEYQAIYNREPPDSSHRDIDAGAVEYAGFPHLVSASLANNAQESSSAIDITCNSSQNPRNDRFVLTVAVKMKDV